MVFTKSQEKDCMELINKWVEANPRPAIDTDLRYAYYDIFRLLEPQQNYTNLKYIAKDSTTLLFALQELQKKYELYAKSTTAANYDHKPPPPPPDQKEQERIRKLREAEEAKVKSDREEATENQKREDANEAKRQKNEQDRQDKLKSPEYTSLQQEEIDIMKPGLVYQPTTIQLQQNTTPDSTNILLAFAIAKQSLYV